MVTDTVERLARKAEQEIKDALARAAYAGRKATIETSPEEKRSWKKIAKEWADIAREMRSNHDNRQPR
jgi:hypothetical protein